MNQRISFILLASYWVAMIIGTHIPIEPFPYAFSWLDKVYHCLTYAVLAVLIVNAFGIRGSAEFGWRTLVGLALLLVLHGAIDELTQSFVPGRFPSLADWTADSIGGLLGVAACWWWIEKVGGRRSSAVRTPC